MSDVCLTCGGLIMEPGKSYGYAGKICHCYSSPKIQRPASETFHYSSLDETERLREENRKLAAELAELKAKPPTFIKLDETTEAFTQTRAAIANMEMFQKDVALLRQQLQSERERALKAEEDVRFYCNEWESACERHQYAQEERDQLKAEVERLNSIINLQEKDCRRYRQALQRIVATRCAWQLSQEIAREALKGEK